MERDDIRRMVLELNYRMDTATELLDDIKILWVHVNTSYYTGKYICKVARTQDRVAAIGHTATNKTKCTDMPNLKDSCRHIDANAYYIKMSINGTHDHYYHTSNHLLGYNKMMPVEKRFTQEFKRNNILGRLVSATEMAV